MSFMDVNTFHRKFELFYDGPPRQLPEDIKDLRVNFLQEELDEYKEAVQAGDLTKQFDALIDLVYVAMGNAQLQGFPWVPGWKEVHRANMSKVRASTAEESKRGHSFDVVKPADFVPPDGALKKLLISYGEFYETKMA